MNEDDVSTAISPAMQEISHASARGLSRCMRTLADEARSLELWDTMSALLAAADLCDSEHASRRFTPVAFNLH
jgi:hypothetical protein